VGVGVKPMTMKMKMMRKMTEQDRIEVIETGRKTDRKTVTEEKTDEKKERAVSCMEVE
jgi:hypothetical protein